MKTLLLSLSSFLTVATCFAEAATIHVSTSGSDATGTGASSAPFATIQKAVDASQNGDVVLVDPGTYSGEGNRAINLRGKQILLRSIAGPIQTIVDLGQRQGVLAHSTETLATVVDGFTFQNGYVESGEDWRGDGIVSILGDSAITLRNCIFRNNETRATYVTTTTGIVVKRDRSSLEIARVENCLFYSNTIGGGGWTGVGGGQAVVVGVCGGEPAIKLIDVVNSTIANNTLYRSAEGADGIRIPVSAGTVRNSIVWGNGDGFFPPTSSYPAPYQTGAQTEVFTQIDYSISEKGAVLSAGAAGNVMTSNPLFTDASNGDFTLATGSPAIDAGDPAWMDPDGSRSDIGFSLARAVASNIDTDGDGLTDAWERGFGRYQIVEGNFTWQEAKADAEAQGGHLGTITSAQEHEFLRANFSGYSSGSMRPWLGGSDVAQEGVWRWVTGEAWSYARWAPNEPNNFGGAQHYLWTGYAGYSEPSTQSWDDAGAEPYGNLIAVNSYLLEFGYPTDPLKSDTDGDGFNDKAESDAGTDPNDASSTPMVTVQGGTLPQSSGLAGTTVSTFSIGKYEVTWREWQEVRSWGMSNGYTDLAVGAGSSPNDPVRLVNQFDIAKWCNARSEKEGLAPVYLLNGQTYKVGMHYYSNIFSLNRLANGYRLPTEAEWEWAARGGVNSQGFAYSGSNDPDLVAWHRGNSSGAPVDLSEGRGSWPVGSKLANELGIHDMSGNVWEFVREGSGVEISRRMRGGGWWHGADLSLLAFRGPINGHNVDLGNVDAGFRVARSEDTNLDSDDDGLLDVYETGTGVFVSPTDTGSNPYDADSSDDGLLDGEVVTAGFNPNTNYTPLFNLVKSKSAGDQARIGLFTENAMMDLNLGGIVLRKLGSTVNLRLQIQSKTDIKASNWTTEGTETFILDMPGNKAFMRIRALGPQ